jgi:hypothetical protein
MDAARSLTERAGASPRPAECRTSPRRTHRWCRIAVAAATTLGTFAVASPAFAWPMMGC